MMSPKTQVEKECINCGYWSGVLVETKQHSQLRDENYRCDECGAKWTLIMEGDRYHRLQLEFPK
jgi:Zn finger protein HypA/HybF involved in hydrogenase expression